MKLSKRNYARSIQFITNTQTHSETLAEILCTEPYQMTRNEFIKAFALSALNNTLFYNVGDPKELLHKAWQEAVMDGVIKMKDGIPVSSLFDLMFKSPYNSRMIRKYIKAKGIIM